MFRFGDSNLNRLICHWLTGRGGGHIQYIAWKSKYPNHISTLPTRNIAPENRHQWQNPKICHWLTGRGATPKILRCPQASLCHRGSHWSLGPDPTRPRLCIHVEGSKDMNNIRVFVWMFRKNSGPPKSSICS